MKWNMVIRIVTDSTASIPAETAQALGITIVPLIVIFGDEAYLDRIELDSASFYRKLSASKVRTSLPPPAAFQQAYMQLIEEGADAIISIHISSKLSGTYQSAWLARETLPGEVKKIPIELVDSQSASIGMTPAILQAAREAREGLGLEEIKAHLLDMLSRTQFLGVLDTLEFVRRSGRLNGAIALLGNMLNVKPILALKNGEIIPVGVSSTRNRAYAHITRQVAAMGKVEQMIAGESSPGTGQRLIEALKAVYQSDIPLYQLGAVLGTHTGPGTAAVAVVTAKQIEGL